MSSNPYDMKQKDDIFTYPPPLSFPPFPLSSPYYYEEESTPSSSSFSRISPVLLWIIVTLAAIFFISGLIHLLIRYLIKKRSSFSIIYHSNRFPDTSRSHSLQRQLQQLFRLHDSGLDQASIDALPVFDYKEIIMGLKEPFDCAVCLCEFSEQDKLRLLPMCGHAFHIDCIGTWLLSNSTCPLCRATLVASSGLPMENQNPLLILNEHSRESSNRYPSSQQQPVILEEDGERRVFSVRLGKLRSLNDEQGETSRMNLDTRRCYSMGSFQYVVGDSNLQVTLPETVAGEVQGDGDAMEGKRIIGRTRGDSFSVSKVWLWSKRSQFQASSSSHMWVPSNLSSSLPTNDSGQFV